MRAALYCLVVETGVFRSYTRGHFSLFRLSRGTRSIFREELYVRARAQWKLI